MELLCNSENAVHLFPVIRNNISNMEILSLLLFIASVDVVLLIFNVVLS